MPIFAATLRRQSAAAAVYAAYCHLCRYAMLLDTPIRLRLLRH